MIANKDEIKEQLTIEQHFELLQEWGGNPEYTNFGIISDTICHNEPGIGSRKLYFYSNSMLYVCYTGCENNHFDIFELVIKVNRIQFHKEYNLYDAIRFIANRCGFLLGDLAIEDNNTLEDWNYIKNHQRIQGIINKTNDVVLKEYDSKILNKFNYDIKIKPWLTEDISQYVIEQAKIGFYAGQDQITIPHFDKDNRFIGLRGRTLCAEEGELYGKYRPIIINDQLYNHPLGMNLYGYNWSKNNIALLKKAIIFESEKSVLKYASYFGWDNNISVACCGSNISNYQIDLLKKCGVNEIIIAFDRQFKEIGDIEFLHLKKNLLKFRDKHKNDIFISFIFDKNMYTEYKASPIDAGKDIFLKLFKERIII